MLLRRMLGLMGGGLQKRQLHLQGRVAQKAGKLGLGDDLGGHQVEKQDLQRTDVLRDRAGLGHHKDVLFLQRAGGRKGIGNLDGH